MKKHMGLIVVAGIGAVVALGVATYVVYAFMGDASAREWPVVREGRIAIGHPELKEDTWYIIHSVEGREGYAAELAFDENSVCASARASGTCLPEVFVNMRAARAEGVWDEKVLRVKKLTFIEPVAQ